MNAPRRTLGLLGGMSWESTAVYYRLLNEGVRARTGNGLASASLLMRSVNFAPLAEAMSQGDWTFVEAELTAGARALRDGGADAILIGTNTMHKLAPQIAGASGLPLLHIGDATGKALQQAGAKRPLLLATAFTMEQPFYCDYLRNTYAVNCITPDDADRAEVHRIIFEELCQGCVLDASRERFRTIIAKAEDTDAVILGCTELGMILSAEDAGVPVLDTTALHADIAVEFLLSGTV